MSVFDYFPFASELRHGVENIVKRFFTDKDKQMEITGELVKLTLEQSGKFIEAQRASIAADAQGAGWLQNNWRAMVMLMFGGVVSYHAVLGHIPIEILLVLLFLGLTGFIASQEMMKKFFEILNSRKEDKP